MKTINELIMEYANLLGTHKGHARDTLAYKLKITENQIVYAATNESMNRKYKSKHVYSPINSQIQNEINHLKALNEAYIRSNINQKQN